MKKTSKIIALTASSIIVFGVGITSIYATLQVEPVQTTLSDLGFAETTYEPPETFTIATEDSMSEVAWNYAYTATFPSASVFTVIGDIDLSAIEEKLYFYQDADGNSISLDEYGRFRSYMVNQDLETRPWISTSLTEDGMFQILGEAAEAFGLDLSDYPDVSFATSEYVENGSSSSFNLYEDASSPVSDWIYAQFDREGALNSIIVTYSNLESVSEQDEQYFTDLLDDYLQTEGITASYTIESNYRERQNILMANLSVTFTDENSVWAENYVAGKPVE